MWLLDRYSELVGIIAPFVLAQPVLSIYLMGSMISFGIYYSLASAGMIKSVEQALLNKKKAYLYAFLSSWLLVIMFLYGILKGLFGKNNEGGY